MEIDDREAKRGVLRAWSGRTGSKSVMLDMGGWGEASGMIWKGQGW